VVFYEYVHGRRGKQGKEAEAGQGLGEDLDARLKELEKYLKGEFYERIKDFWYEALKYYVGNVLDISELEKEFGKIEEISWGNAAFYRELRFQGYVDMASAIREKPGIYPESISYHNAFTIRFFKGVIITFYNAVVLCVDDARTKTRSYIILDFTDVRIIKI
jgi:hypothetical protein